MSGIKNIKVGIGLIFFLWSGQTFAEAPNEYEFQFKELHQYLKVAVLDVFAGIPVSEEELKQPQDIVLAAKAIQIAGEASLPMQLSFNSLRTRLVHDQPLNAEQYAHILVRVDLEQARLKQKFLTLKDLSLPRARKRMIELGNNFVLNLQKAEKIYADDRLQAMEFVKLSLDAYEEAILQAYKASWTNKELRKHILDLLEGDNHIISASKLAGIVAGAITLKITESQFVLDILVLLARQFVPNSITGPEYQAVVSIIDSVIRSETFRYVFSTLLGMTAVPIYRTAMVYRWKSKNKVPLVPTEKVLSNFWDQVKSFNYTVPTESAERAQWVLTHLESAAKAPLCSYFLKTFDKPLSNETPIP